MSRDFAGSGERDFLKLIPDQVHDEIGRLTPAEIQILKDVLQGKATVIVEPGTSFSSSRNNPTSDLLTFCKRPTGDFRIVRARFIEGLLSSPRLAIRENVREISFTGISILERLDLSRLTFDFHVRFQKSYFHSGISLKQSTVRKLEIENCVLFFESHECSTDSCLDLEDFRADYTLSLDQSQFVSLGAQSCISLLNAKVNGKITLVGASLMHDWCDSCKLNNSPINSHTSRAESLIRCSDSASISGDGLECIDLFATGGIFAGQVRLPGSTIKGQCDLSETTFYLPRIASYSSSNSENYPLIYANGIQVNAELFLNNLWMDSGAALLKNAIVGTTLKLSGRIPRRIDLSFSSTSVLGLRIDSLPMKDSLLLFHFSYRRLEIEKCHHSKLAEMTELFLLSQNENELSYDVFERAARYFREVGDLKGSKRFRIAAEKAWLRELKTRLDSSELSCADQFWTFCMYVRKQLEGIIVNYGYSPLKVLFPSILLWLFGSLVFQYLFKIGGLRPLAQEAKAISQLTSNFSSLAFSLDLMVPFLDLQLDKYWLLNINSMPSCLGWLTQSYYWLHICLGWFFMTLFLGAVTGYIKRE